MNSYKKTTFLCRLIAALSCFALIVTAICPIPAHAAATEALSLKYNGKTVVVEAPDGSIASYKKLKNVFGTAAKQYQKDGMNAYKCKASGCSLLLEPWWADDTLNGYSVTIEITSKKAALNGIKVGMSYDSVQAKLEKKYGKASVDAKDNEINLINVANSYIQYSFKNGKVKRIDFFHS